MKTNNFLLFAASIFILLAGTVLAVTPTVMNYQGLLNDDTGAPVANGDYSVTFTIYDAAEGGNSKWTETQSITTADGFFAVLLGSVNPIEDTVFNAPARFLGIQVGSDTELSPRTMMVTAPYSFRTSTIDGASGGNITSSLSIGDESTGYELPASDGTSDQVMSTDGAGQVNWSDISGGGGSTFIRWGNSAAPAGSSLLYSGFGYANHFTHSRGNSPIVLQSGDPGSTNLFANNLYPLATQGSTPNIPDSSYIHAAVCYADNVTTLVWGSHTPPSGWSAMYLGYALAGYYQHGGASGPICVECIEFESALGADLDNALVYGLGIGGTAPGNTDLLDNHIKCMVIKKQ